MAQHRGSPRPPGPGTAAGRQDDDLYRGVRLAAVTRGWSRRRTGSGCTRSSGSSWTAPTPPSRPGAVAVRRRTRRLRALVAALSVLLLVASGAVVVAERAAGSRRCRPRQLSLARQLAAESRTMTNVDPRRAALLALGSWRAAQTVESRSALLVAADAQYRGSVQASADGSVSAVAIGRRRPGRRHRRPGRHAAAVGRPEPPGDRQARPRAGLVPVGLDERGRPVAGRGQPDAPAP